MKVRCLSLDSPSRDVFTVTELMLLVFITRKSQLKTFYVGMYARDVEVSDPCSEIWGQQHGTGQSGMLCPGQCLVLLMSFVGSKCLPCMAAPKQALSVANTIFTVRITRNGAHFHNQHDQDFLRGKVQPENSLMIPWRSKDVIPLRDDSCLGFSKGPETYFQRVIISEKVQARENIKRRSDEGKIFKV